ncbi:MAG: biotin-dependent carboxyltransferase family protein [Gordonia sp. (in: high G+C Gram-positive bacteria)]
MSFTVLTPGPLATIQDLGRSGYQHLGVPRSGGADRDSMMLANRLVGNDESAATIEMTLGGLRLRAESAAIVAVTGAHTTVTIDGTPVGQYATTIVSDGAELVVGTPDWGCRNYLAVRGGFAVTAVLGSRSTDTLSGLGPAALRAGDVLPVGAAGPGWPPVTTAPRDNRRPDVVELDAGPGPRRDHLRIPGDLYTGHWEVTPASNRIGVRLARPPESGLAVLRHRDDIAQLRSEPVAHGSVQVPPAGEPIIFLADHPVTGGYPVCAVLTARSMARAAQLVTGQRVRFRPI